MSDPRLKKEIHPKLPSKENGCSENPFSDPWKMGAWDMYVKRSPDNPFDKGEEYGKWKEYDDGYFSAWHDML